MDRWFGLGVDQLRRHTPRAPRRRWWRGFCGRGVMGLGWFMVITAVVIILMGTEHQQAAFIVTKIINSAVKTVLSQGLDEGNGAVQLEHYARSSELGPYSQWASWVPHLCPRLLRTTTLPGLNLTWEQPTEQTIFFTQTSCSSTLTPREVYKRFSTITVM